MPVVGDFDGDGKDELAAPMEGGVHIFDEVAGELSMVILDEDVFGLDGAGDFNGDGVGDFVGSQTIESGSETLHVTTVFVSNP